MMEDYDDETIQMWLNADEWFEIGEPVSVTLLPDDKYYSSVSDMNYMEGWVSEILPDKKYKVKHVMYGKAIEEIYNESQLSHCPWVKDAMPEDGEEQYSDEYERREAELRSILKHYDARHNH